MLSAVEDTAEPEASEETTTPESAAALAAAAVVEGPETPVKKGGEGAASEIGDWPTGEEGADMHGDGIATAAEETEKEEERGPAEADLLEAIRGIPASVEDVSKLTSKQVRCGLQNPNSCTAHKCY